jgi:hypothetical protein
MPTARDQALIRGFPAMHRSRHPKVSAALIGLVLLNVLCLTGCSDQPQSGTVVEDTPEAQEGRKKSMDGMKALMDKKGRAQAPQPSR